MKIELKKIVFNERMSEETRCFVADLYINGKKVGYCKNDGRGGCTDYNAYNPEDRKAIREAEEHCKTLPHDRFGEISLEDRINDLLEDYLKAKFELKAKKKFEKLQQTSIIWGKPDTYGNMHLPYSVPLSHVAKVQPQKLQERIDAIKEKYCSNGDIVILNTNLKELGINI